MTTDTIELRGWGRTDNHFGIVTPDGHLYMAHLNKKETQFLADEMAYRATRMDDE